MFISRLQTTTLDLLILRKVLANLSPIFWLKCIWENLISPILDITRLWKTHSALHILIWWNLRIEFVYSYVPNTHPVCITHVPISGWLLHILWYRNTSCNNTLNLENNKQHLGKIWSYSSRLLSRQWVWISQSSMVWWLQVFN